MHFAVTVASGEGIGIIFVFDFGHLFRTFKFRTTIQCNLISKFTDNLVKNTCKAEAEADLWYQFPYVSGRTTVTNF